MLKFPRSLNELDPLPPFEGDFDDWDMGLDTPASKRHVEEYYKPLEAANGMDWKEILGRPYFFRNSEGKLRYSPPLPRDEQTHNNKVAVWEKHAAAKTPPYGWVGKRLPKKGDWVKIARWSRHYKVVEETDNVIFLQDSTGSSSDYTKIRDITDWWIFADEENITPKNSQPPFKPGDRIILAWRADNTVKTVIECVRYKDFWPRMHKALGLGITSGPAYKGRDEDWVVCYGLFSEWCWCNESVEKAPELKEDSE